MISAALFVSTSIVASAILGYLINHTYWSRKLKVRQGMSSINPFLMLISGALPTVALSCFGSFPDALVAFCFFAALFGGYQGASRALNLTRR